MKVYLDPGHGEGVTGGRDPGAVGPTGLTENTVTFDLAKRLGHLLRAKGFTTLGTTLNAARDDENLNEAIAAANAQAQPQVALNLNTAGNQLGPDLHEVVLTVTVNAKAGENPLFKKVLDSQKAFAERAGQWQNDYTVDFKMAWNHYFRGKKG